MKEIWKPFKDYEDRYEISSYGRVKELERVFYCGKDNKSKRQCKERYKTISIDTNGYPIIYVKKNEKKKVFRIHRLVAKHFIANPKGKPQVNHIDGNKQNNNVKNLEWVTNKENVHHAWKTGLCKKRNGKDSPHARLSEKDVKRIRKLHEITDLSASEIASIYKVSKSNISAIIRRETWKAL